MQSTQALLKGTQAIRAFVEAAQNREITAEEVSSLACFLDAYTKIVSAHLDNTQEHNFSKFLILAATTQARFQAPKNALSECETEGGCEGCLNHFCKRY